MSGQAAQRRSLLWSRVIAGVVAFGATGGMATATVWQLAAQSPAAAASTPPAWNRGGGSPPLYPEPPVVVPETVPVPLKTAKEDGGDGGTKVFGPRLPAVYGVPGRVLAAYRNTVQALAGSQPGCGLQVPLLAAIGRVESGHARGGDLDARGRTRHPILGPRLDGGPGVMAIRDTDDGAYDGDRVWDRAVGPAQFIPSTWQRWGSDANGDGAADPHHIDDAWLAAGRYLCTAGGDLRRSEGVRRAVLAYNHSDAYLRLVLSWMRVYAGNIVPSAAAPSAASSPRPEAERSPQTRPSGQSSAPPEDRSSQRSPSDDDPPAPTRPGTPPNTPPLDDLPDPLKPSLPEPRSSSSAAPPVPLPAGPTG
ncbi:lytic transglycosylase domain-containing protein [Streptomyces himalayensis]|uniref:lytic transglycosylase domain-containing protein n=1 Tax=Streptomyces himalayensis TaxID=2820085 RepID=UPI0028AB7A17|nr:lytic transglycosylase domain-containing protein [Streptomyces himalayensis]